jgi:AraC-like DNA-binding protein
LDKNEFRLDKPSRGMRFIFGAQLPIMLHFQVSIASPHVAHFTFEPPVHLLTRLIPQASIAYCEQPWGIILFQEIAINGFTVGKYSFDLNEHCEVSLNFTRKLVVLQHATKGLPEIDNSISISPFIDLHHGLYYLPPGQSIKLKFPVGRYNFWQIHFTLSLIKKFTHGQPGFTHFHQPDRTIGIFCSTALPIDKKTKTMLSSLNQHLMDTPLNAYYINRRCLHLLMRFITDHAHFQLQQKRTAVKDNQTVNLEDLVRSQFTGELNEIPTTKALAQKLNLSVFLLNKLSREMYSMTASALIAKVRMDIAVSLLAQQELSVIEISTRTGYQDTSSFSRAFKKRFGFPPSQFSKDHA